ncbi:hypothetical protein [Streptomyces sp. UNOC14_S4]|uniref:hypothetical protein n=1 Tax=Streptomyces sp. UNOC14_S4 TaxID=2872340 RepID=UPI001E3B4112|nr:hypothetical protein [Streptomyces sp. UNOC14_S4]MCC3772193.1 hypothetical protein [Streptomyces sp. UNOC14_S4]
MSDLGFYVHAVTRREILGAGIRTTPDAWAAALGQDYVENHGGGTFLRDYGLVEISFAEETESGNVACFGFGLKPHRLLGSTEGYVPQALLREYGPFANRVRFDTLRAAIEAAGRTLEHEDGGGGDDIHRYRVVESGARIHVIVDPDPYGYGHDPDDPEESRAGDVLSIDVSPMWWGTE